MEKLIPQYNTESIPGQKYELIGIVKGSMIQSKHIGRDISNMLKSIVGGELKGYSEMINEARVMASKRMMAEADRLGADAVVNVRYTTSNVMQSAAEILVYGTAVKFI